MRITTIPIHPRIAIIGLILLLAASFANAQTYSGYIDEVSFASRAAAETYLNNQLWTSNGVLSTMYLPIYGGRASWVVRHPCTTLETCSTAANYSALPWQGQLSVPPPFNTCVTGLSKYEALNFDTEAAMNACWNGTGPCSGTDITPWQNGQKDTVIYKGRTVAGHAPWVIVRQQFVLACAFE